MSTSTTMPVFDGRPLESLKKNELSTLCGLLELEPAKNKATKPELYNYCKAGLAKNEARFIKDPRFSHFYIYQEGGAAEPRKTSADKQQDNDKTVTSNPTPALMKLTLAKVSLDPPGQRVPRGILDQLPYGSSDEADEASNADNMQDLGTEDSDSEQPSPTVAAASRKLAPAARGSASNLTVVQHRERHALAGPGALLPPGSPRNSMDFGLGFFASVPSPPPLPSPNTRDVSVHLHYPNAPVEEVQIQLDNSVEDIPFGLVDDPWTTKSARLTEMVPKVLDAHTPLKNTRGVLKSRGRNSNQLKYLGSLDKIKSGDYAKFSMQAADTQALVNEGGRYKLDLWVFPDDSGPAPVTHPTHAPASMPGAPASSSAQPTTSAGPAPAATAAGNVDKDEAFIVWLRNRLTEFNIAMPSKRLPGDTLGHAAVRVRLYDAVTAALEDNGWRISDREGWKVPESEERYAGCSFTLAGFFKLFHIGRTQGIGDWALFKDNFDAEAHEELQAFREDPDEYADIFMRMKRKQVDTWKKEKLEEKQEREREERNRQRKREQQRKREREREHERDPVRRSHAPSQASSSRFKRGRSASPQEERRSRREDPREDRFSRKASSSSRYMQVDEDDEIAGDEDDSDASQDVQPRRGSRKAHQRLTSETLDD